MNGLSDKIRSMVMMSSRTVLLYSAGFFLFLVVFEFIFHWGNIDSLFGALVLSLVGGILTHIVVWKYYSGPLRGLAFYVQHMLKEKNAAPLGVSRQDDIGFLVRSLGEVSEEYRLKVKTAIRETEEIKAVFSNMVEGVLVINNEDLVTHVSASAKKLLDLRTDSSVGHYYWEVVRQNEINALIKKCFSSGKPVDQDIVIANPEQIFFHVQISPIMSSGGRVHSVVIVFHDISVLKRFDKMRSDFVSNVSHELKTPLTSIKGFVETLKSGALNDPHEAMRFLDIIDVQAGRLERLVSDVLSLSSIEAKLECKESVVRSMEAVRSIVDAVVVLYQRRISEKEILFSVDVAQGLPTVNIDRGQIEQVISNLLDNAVKFTSKGGEISLQAALEKDLVRIDVKDNGVGIADEHQARIFERFYRVDKARSQEYSGTGLGLAIVKNIVISHGGYVSLKSAPGQGSVFSVFLPVDLSK